MLSAKSHGCPARTMDSAAAVIRRRRRTASFSLPSVLFEWLTQRRKLRLSGGFEIAEWCVQNGPVTTVRVPGCAARKPRQTKQRHQQAKHFEIKCFHEIIPNRNFFARGAKRFAPACALSSRRRREPCSRNPDSRPAPRVSCARRRNNSSNSRTTPSSNRRSRVRRREACLQILFQLRRERRA